MSSYHQSQPPVIGTSIASRISTVTPQSPSMMLPTMINNNSTITTNNSDIMMMHTNNNDVALQAAINNSLLNILLASNAISSTAGTNSGMTGMNGINDLQQQFQSSFQQYQNQNQNQIPMQFPAPSTSVTMMNNNHHPLPTNTNTNSNTTTTKQSKSKVSSQRELSTSLSHQNSQFQTSNNNKNNNVNNSANIDDHFSKDYLNDDEMFLKIAGKVLIDHEMEILKHAMKEVATLPPNQINIGLMKNYKRRWFDKTSLRTISQTVRGGLVKSTFYAMVLRQYLINQRQVLPDVFAFNDFANILYSGPLSLLTDRRENDYHLLGFIRAVKGLLDLKLTAMSNKHVYLNVGAMLEGSGLSYATGGAPSKSTQRRLAIITQMTGITTKRTRSISMSDGDIIDGENDGEDHEHEHDQEANQDDLHQHQGLNAISQMFGNSSVPSFSMHHQVSPEWMFSKHLNTSMNVKHNMEAGIVVEGDIDNSPKRQRKTMNLTSIYDPTTAPPSKYMQRDSFPSTTAYAATETENDAAAENRERPDSASLNEEDSNESNENAYYETIPQDSLSCCSGQDTGKTFESSSGEIMNDASKKQAQSRSDIEALQNLSIGGIFSLLATYASFLPTNGEIGL